MSMLQKHHDLASLLDQLLVEKEIGKIQSHIVVLQPDDAWAVRQSMRTLFRGKDIADEYRKISRSFYSDLHEADQHAHFAWHHRDALLHALAVRSGRIERNLQTSDPVDIAILDAADGWQGLCNQAGGQRQAAKLLHVDERTMRRWVAGDRAGPWAAAELLRRMAKDL